MQLCTTTRSGGLANVVPDSRMNEQRQSLRVGAEGDGKRLGEHALGRGTAWARAGMGRAWRMSGGPGDGSPHKSGRERFDVEETI